MIRRPTAEEFLEDVAAHRMTMQLSSDIHRHLHFAKPGTSNHWFDIVTWPGFLTIAGDMGTWTFSRVLDMFNFFRSSKELKINPSYWSEKLQNGHHGGEDACKVFDMDLFAQQLMESLSGYSLEGERLEEVIAAIHDDVLVFESQHELYNAAHEFKITFADGSKFEFDCEGVPSGTDFGYHFIWCLYAIVWGIQQWDALACN